jgi:hypothetical protein
MFTLAVKVIRRPKTAGRRFLVRMVFEPKKGPIGGADWGAGAGFGVLVLVGIGAAEGVGVGVGVGVEARTRG